MSVIAEKLQEMFPTEKNRQNFIIMSILTFGLTKESIASLLGISIDELLTSYVYPSNYSLSVNKRWHHISNSQNERTKEIIDILEHVLIYYKEMGLYEEYKVELEYIYTRYLLCSSFLRMVKIRNKKTRKELLKLAWESLNKTFPNWKKNEILRKEKSAKNKYMKTVNHLTFPIYAFLFQFKG